MDIISTVPIVSLSIDNGIYTEPFPININSLIWIVEKKSYNRQIINNNGGGGGSWCIRTRVLCMAVQRGLPLDYPYLAVPELAEALGPALVLSVFVMKFLILEFLTYLVHLV